MTIERRRHPRIQVTWPVIVKTSRGSIEGETKDISVGGAFIKYSEKLELGEDFQIVLKPTKQRSISVTGEKVWSGSLNINGKTVFSGMGVRFTEISSEDRQFISALHEKKSKE